MLRNLEHGPGAEQRFWAKVKKTDLCWLWTASLNGGGYGQFWFGHGLGEAHRFAYELQVGPIPEGLTLDHLCRNRRCVRPDHLEAVTRGENVLRGEGTSARHARQTHCIHGHPFDETNTVINIRGQRVCRICAKLRNRRCYERKHIIDAREGMEPIRVEEWIERARAA